jgi:glycosyltransferase involved in cell wall biosynthesis
MALHTAVVIATKNRPQEVSNLLDVLALQTVLPDVVIVSASDPSDIKQNDCAALNIQTVFGPPGLTAQRNRALSLVRDKYDIVVFFDDDFIPSRFWIERIQILLATYPGVGCVTGLLLADGVKSGGMEWTVGKSMVHQSDCSKQIVSKINQIIKDHVLPYGCNMAFRTKAIEQIEFDERLALYGWLEDRDFGFRVALEAKMISTDFLWGVHLGTSQGRISGLRFGYSQTVNPWYLMRKGTMRPIDAYSYIARGIVRNAAGSIFDNSEVDRWGRFKGNLMGLRDIVTNCWAPEKIKEPGVFY